MNDVLKTTPETSCSCKVCEMMCHRSPCFPTPADVVRLEAAGFGDLLLGSAYQDPDGNRHYAVAPMFFGHPNPKDDVDIGRCVFLLEGKCFLHDLGLKPTEGRLAHHNRKEGGLRVAVCDTWISREGIDIMERHHPGFAVELKRKYLFQPFQTEPEKK